MLISGVIRINYSCVIMVICMDVVLTIFWKYKVILGFELNFCVFLELKVYFI